MALLLALAFLATSCCSAVNPRVDIGVRGATLKGPFTPVTTSYTDSSLDSSDRRVTVVYPAENGSFPLVAFAHGLDNDSSKDYTELFDGLVSFGYVVVAPLACKEGCKDDTTSLPDDPSGFAHYYKQQLRAITWARAQCDAGDPVFSKLNFTGGVAIAGHSMGGQSTLFSSSAGNASLYGIKAAVMLHAFTHQFPAPQVPFLTFTGALDIVAPASMAESIFAAEGGAGSSTVLNKGIIDKATAGHFEPENNWLPWKTYNPLLPQFTAAWFKLHVEGKASEFGINFEDMLYGNSTDSSICHGADGDMSKCDIRRA